MLQKGITFALRFAMSITEAAASVTARAFFYPSLAWNIARNRLQETWHWWDEITPVGLRNLSSLYTPMNSLFIIGFNASMKVNKRKELEDLALQ